MANRKHAGRLLSASVMLGVIVIVLSGCLSLLYEEIMSYSVEVPEETIRQLEDLQSSDWPEARCDAFEVWDRYGAGCSPPEVCSSTEECAELGDRLADLIYEQFGDLLYFDFEREFDEYDEYDETDLVYYKINDDRLSEPEYWYIDEKMTPYRDNLDEHIRMWNILRYIIPEHVRPELIGFTVFTDGVDNTLAHVTPDETDLTKWWLGVDILDVDPIETLVTTYLHEYAHIVTLGSNQLHMDADILFADEDDPIHDSKAQQCPRLFVEGMGCVYEHSYLYEFYKRFWLDIEDEWRERNVANDEDELSAFFADYEDQFVTEYAATYPEEDIAESWAYFILYPQIEAYDIWEQKIMFFYEYPEHVKLRAEILSRILSYFTLYHAK